jgi:hypothetical protein
MLADRRRGMPFLRNRSDRAPYSHLSAVQVAVMVMMSVILGVATGLVCRASPPAVRLSETSASTEKLPDFDIKIIGARSKSDPLYGRVALALKSSPLNLEVELDNAETILGVSSRRLSKILLGWREIVTVRVDIYDNVGSASLPCEALKISTTIYVNRQNTDRSSDWTLPTNQQERRWVESIRRNLRKALTGFCKNQKWLGKGELRCN